MQDRWMTVRRREVRLVGERWASGSMRGLVLNAIAIRRRPSASVPAVIRIR